MASGSLEDLTDFRRFGFDRGGVIQTEGWSGGAREEVWNSIGSRQDKTVYAAETELGARVTLGRGKRVCIRYKNFASWLRRRQEGIDPVSFRLLKDVGGLVSHGNYDLHNGASGQLRSFGSKGSVRDRSDTEHDRKLHEFDRVSVGLSQLECSWFGQSDTHELARQHTCSLGCPGCGRRGGRDVGRRVSSGHGR